MKIKIISGRDKGKIATVVKYIGDEAYRVKLENNISTIVYAGEFVKC